MWWQSQHENPGLLVPGAEPEPFRVSQVGFLCHVGFLFPLLASPWVSDNLREQKGNCHVAT